MFWASFIQEEEKRDREEKIREGKIREDEIIEEELCIPEDVKEQMLKELHEFLNPSDDDLEPEEPEEPEEVDSRFLGLNESFASLVADLKALRTAED